ncbi:MAG TPA: ribosomal protein L13e, partial [Candidatus Glassbacteria bacterium]|nr:ribosomal protein L13e [Candidatus Glassbacteria bacterium]
MKNASVVSPGYKTPRTGRGFSKDELAAAKFSIKEAREAGLIVDLRRLTKYPENIASLKEIKVDYAKYLVEKEKELVKVRKDNAKSRKEAAKRKADVDLTLQEKEKEIEKVKKEVQEEIARREAEEILDEQETLSEDELSEIDELETALEGEETPEG